MYDLIKTTIEEKGYLGLFDPEKNRLAILALNGWVRENGEPKRSFVAQVRMIEGKISINEIRTGYHLSWEVDKPEDVLAYLLKEFPNIPLGEENTWE